MRLRLIPQSGQPNEGIKGAILLPNNSIQLPDGTTIKVSEEEYRRFLHESNRGVITRPLYLVTGENGSIHYSLDEEGYLPSDGKYQLFAFGGRVYVSLPDFSFHNIITGEKTIVSAWIPYQSSTCCNGIWKPHKDGSWMVGTTNEIAPFHLITEFVFSEQEVSWSVTEVKYYNVPKATNHSVIRGLIFGSHKEKNLFNYEGEWYEVHQGKPRLVERDGLKQDFRASLWGEITHQNETHTFVLS